MSDAPMSAGPLSTGTPLFRIERRRDLDAAPVLSALGAESFCETFGDLYRPEDLNAFLREHHSPDCYRRLIADPERAVWTATTQEGETAAYASAGPCGLPVENPPARSGELLRLYVLGRFQGAALGRRLLKTALDWLEGRFDAVYLSVYAENHGAQRLYARHGFEKVGEYCFMVGEHADPEYIMKRRRA